MHIKNNKALHYQHRVSKLKAPNQPSLHRIAQSAERLRSVFTLHLAAFAVTKQEIHKTQILEKRSPKSRQIYVNPSKAIFTSKSEPKLLNATLLADLGSVTSIRTCQ